MPRRELRDAVHGFILRDDVEEAIIDSPVFQRLRKIRQLAMASLVYPGAMHSRFEHSVGAMHVAGRIADVTGLEDGEKRLVRLAALLHDIGHGPFSHVSEPAFAAFSNTGKFKLKPGERVHESITSAIIEKDESLKRLLSEVDRERIVGILNGEYGDSVLKDIVSGPLDADKQDYLLRDSHFCGVQYGVFDLDRLLGTLAIRSDSDDRYLVIRDEGVHALEQFVLAKYYMNTQVYRHKIRLITDAMIERALDLGVRVDGVEWLKKLFAFDGSEAHLDYFKTWTDDRLMNEAIYGNTPDGYLKSLFVALTERRLHKRVAKYAAVEFDALVRSALTQLNQEQQLELEARIASYLNVDANLVMIKTFTIKSVREQSRNSEASIIVLKPDVTRVFEEESTLFRSIDEAIRETHIEVYAPIKFHDEKHKRKLRAQYQTEIRGLMSTYAKEKSDKGEA